MIGIEAYDLIEFIHRKSFIALLILPRIDSNRTPYIFIKNSFSEKFNLYSAESRPVQFNSWLLSMTTTQKCLKCQILIEFMALDISTRE